MATTQNHIKIPRWMPWFYGMISFWLVPWTLYLMATLPEQHLSMQWRLMWVVFDVALLIMSALVTYFLYKKSPWVNMALAALAALFVSDAWFDFMTSTTTTERQLAFFTGVLIEVPLALISLLCAVYIMRQIVAERSVGEEKQGKGA